MSSPFGTFSAVKRDRCKTQLSHLAWKDFWNPSQFVKLCLVDNFVQTISIHHSLFLASFFFVFPPIPPSPAFKKNLELNCKSESCHSSYGRWTAPWQLGCPAFDSCLHSTAEYERDSMWKKWRAAALGS